MMAEFNLAPSASWSWFWMFSFHIGHLKFSSQEKLQVLLITSSVAQFHYVSC